MVKEFTGDEDHMPFDQKGGETLTPALD